MIMANVNYKYRNIANDINNLKRIMYEVNSSKDAIEAAYNGMDYRVKDYLSYMKIPELTRNMGDWYNDMDGYKSWLSNSNESAYNHQKAIERDNAESFNALKTTIDSTFGSGNKSISGVGTSGDYSIDANAWANLPSDVKDSVIASLKNAGYTDDEVNKIISGEETVKKQTVNRISTIVESLSKTNSSVRGKLKDLFGFDLFKDGSVEPNLLTAAIFISSKGLGYDVDTSSASVFSSNKNVLSYALQKEYKDNPGIRKQIEEEYGLDIFKDDGTVDDDKLILVLFMDGAKKDDALDISKYVADRVQFEDGKYKLAFGGSLGSNAEFGTGIKKRAATDFSSSVTKGKTGSRGAVGAAESSAKLQAAYGLISGNSEENNKNKMFGFNSRSMSRLIPELSEKLKDGLDKSAMLAVGAGAASSVASGSALVRKSTKKLKFDKTNFAALDQKTREAFINCLEQEGLQKPEIEIVMTSTYKISENRLYKYINSLEKAAEISKLLTVKINDMYGFDPYKSDGTIDEFKMFLILIVDGVSIGNKHNLFKILNNIFEDPKDKNNSYIGIYYEKYLAY